MTAYVLDLVLRMRKTHKAHTSVAAGVIAVALASATFALGPVPPGALRSGPEELITVPAPPTNGPDMPQSLQYLQYDWSAASALGLPS